MAHPTQQWLLNCKRTKVNDCLTVTGKHRYIQVTHIQTNNSCFAEVEKFCVYDVLTNIKMSQYYSFSGGFFGGGGLTMIVIKMLHVPLNITIHYTCINISQFDTKAVILMRTFSASMQMKKIFFQLTYRIYVLRKFRITFCTLPSSNLRKMGNNFADPFLEKGMRLQPHIMFI